MEREGVEWEAAGWEAAGTVVEARATVTVVEARAAVTVAVTVREAARSYDTCEGGGGEG